MSRPPVLRLETFITPESPIPYYIAHSIFKESTEVPEHSHTFFELFVVRRGCLIHILNGTKYEIENRCVKFVLPSDSHSFKKHPKSDFAILSNLAFPSSVVDSVCTMLGLDFHDIMEYLVSHISITHDSVWDLIVKKIDRLIELSHKDANAHQTVLFHSLLFDIFTEYMGMSRSPLETVPKWLSDACREMQKKENYSDGLPRFIELSGKSQEHLTRKLREYYDISPSQFINNLRLEEAGQVLINSDQSVADLCFAVGFENLSYFIKLFKEKYGVSPLKYRQKNMKNVRHHEFYNRF